jgi:hypothetical protein
MDLSKLNITVPYDRNHIDEAMRVCGLHRVDPDTVDEAVSWSVIGGGEDGIFTDGEYFVMLYMLWTDGCVSDCVVFKDNKLVGLARSKQPQGFYHYTEYVDSQFKEMARIVHTDMYE